MRRLVLGLVGVLGLACSADDAVTAGGPPTFDGNPSMGDGTNPGSSSGQTPGGGGAGIPPGFNECGADTFTAGLRRAANIVWVIDTSGSMREEATLVQDNMNRFVQSIVAAGLEDYRVVVVSQSSFVSVPAPLGTDSAHFLYVEEKVGSHQPLEDLRDRFDAYQGFLLSGAITHFIVVTDDESDLPATTFVSQMRGLLAGADFKVHAVASPPVATSGSGNWWDQLFGDDDEGCEGVHGSAADVGAQHYAAADQTGGLTFSICESDWSGLFSELATEVGESATIPCDVAIPEGEAGQAVDPHLVNVILSTGGQADVLRQVPSAECAGGGWSYDNPENPKRIILCPASCEKARGDAELQIAVGCETVLQ